MPTQRRSGTTGSEKKEFEDARNSSPRMKWKNPFHSRRKQSGSYDEYKDNDYRLDIAEAKMHIELARERSEEEEDAKKYLTSKGKSLAEQGVTDIPRDFERQFSEDFYYDRNKLLFEEYRLPDEEEEGNNEMWNIVIDDNMPELMKRDALRLLHEGKFETAFDVKRYLRKLAIEGKVHY